MTASNRRDEFLDLSRDEQWVLHHILLDRIELEAQYPGETNPPPLAVYRVFEKLEEGTYRFSRDERRCLIDELRQYTDSIGTPERDQPITERLLDKLRQSESMGSTIQSAP